MANNNDDHEVGYCKPPGRTRFVKGQSGNPKGRPKGSQSLATILTKVGRQRVKVTENGRTRDITKSEAAVLQLWNKVVSGDLNAARVLQSWLTSFVDSEQTAVASPASHERDKLVMESLLERIRQSEDLPQDNGTDPVAKDPPRREK